MERAEYYPEPNDPLIEKQNKQFLDQEKVKKKHAENAEKNDLAQIDLAAELKKLEDEEKESNENEKAV